MSKHMWWPVLRVMVALLLVCPSPLTTVQAVPLLGAVGDGTPESCTEAALDAALATEGLVTFNCGTEPHTITLTSVKAISGETSLDGGLPGRITLSGGNLTQLFMVEAAGSLSLLNLVLADGNSGGGNGGAIYNAGRLTLVNSQATHSAAGEGSGGAIYNNTG